MLPVRLQPKPFSNQTIPPVPAFIIARAMRGTAHTFQVYLTPKRVYFIRIGAGPGADLALAAHGGLIGALLIMGFASYRKKKQAQKIEENRVKTPDQMLADHKINHAVDFADASDMSLQSGGWMLAKGSVNWEFQVRGEKKRVKCTFRKIEDISTGMNELPKLFPDIRINVHLDPKSGKYLKNRD